MKVSIILPTRHRREALTHSMGSLLGTCARAELEFMLGIDEDDPESIQFIGEGNFSGIRALVFQRLGYRNLHLYVNALCAHSSGDWLVLWNDDALMETKGWDLILESFGGRLVVVNPATNHGNHALGNCIFPIIPRRLFEILGHFSLSNHNDSYIENIANALGIRADVPITVLHDRADLTGANDDDVFAEREFTTGQFYGSEIQRAIAEDIAKLRPHVERDTAVTGELPP